MGTRTITTATVIAGILAGAACGQSDRPGVAWGSPAAEAQDEAATLNGSHEHTPRRVWAGEFVGFRETSVSPDGRFITWREPPRPGIVVRDMETDVLHPIIEPPVDPDAFHDFWGALFSRDGRRIAFTWYTFRDGRQEIGVGVADFEADGANGPRASVPRLAYANPVREAYPFDWSPDGNWILAALYSTDATGSLALLPITGDTARVFESFGWRSLGRALFSPDGRFVAYDVPPENDSRARHVHVVSLDGSRKQLIVGGAGQNRLFAWAPDGSILYQKDQDGAPSLWRQPMSDGAPAGRPELLRNDLWRTVPIGFGGGAFHYGTIVDRPTLQVVEFDLATGLRHGSPHSVEVPLDGEAGAFAWSPDGGYLAHMHRRGDRSVQLTLHAADGAVVSERSLRFTNLMLNGLRWAPDGGSLMAFARDDRGRAGFHRISLGTGEDNLVLRVDPNATRPRFALSRDGATLYYVTSGSLLVRHSLATGEERTIGPAFSPAPPPVVLSPDETEIATLAQATDTDSALLAIVMPAKGGAYREVFRVTWPAVIGSLDWTPDGAALLVAVSRHLTTPLDSELWLVPSHGAGEARKLESPGNFHSRRVSLHPGGRRLAYVTGENRGEIWALDLGELRTVARAGRASP